MFVVHFDTFPCHPLQNINVKWPNTKFYVELWIHQGIFFYPSENTIPINSVSGQLDSNRPIAQVNKWQRTVKSMNFVFKMHFTQHCCHDCVNCPLSRKCYLYLLSTVIIIVNLLVELNFVKKSLLLWYQRHRKVIYRGVLSEYRKTMKLIRN